jgi:hypothetical protein
MNESVSETIKDPSEAFLAIGTAIQLTDALSITLDELYKEEAAR